MGLFDRLRSEATYAAGALRILRRVTPIARNRTRTFSDVFDELAARHGDRVALLSAEERLTYAGLAERANRYARWALERGIGTGDTVALMMHNRPEYLAMWMGITRVGGVVALVNTNLRGQGLAHSLGIVGARQLIVGGDLIEAYETAEPLLDAPPELWVAGADTADRQPIEPVIETLPGDALPAGERAALTIDEPALYIYTSGTTGLPKAAVINHYRLQAAMAGYAALTNSRSTDRIYNTLPLYHTTGGLIAPGIALMAGGACFIRERFSASRFWPEVVEHDCTMFQYIGELCRYLLQAPPTPEETRHRIRLCNGNGLRPDIWTEFKTRFGIPQIVEWYAATEGNVILFNLDGRPGAVGRIPWWLERRFQTKLVRFDIETETPVRDGEGRCIECAPDEVGEAVGRILVDPSAPGQRFDGYADKAATEAKILRDAFEPGDAWFRTGDLMKKDALGYYYFIDRIGDTFRWKGENVATSEVAEITNVFSGVRETVVFGVAVPGHDGRAGMAAIVVDDGIDLDALAAHLDARLPSYAVPVFLRLTREIEVTGTFKQSKLALRREGFDPGLVADELYVRDPESRRFERLDRARHDEITEGGARL